SNAATRGCHDGPVTPRGPYPGSAPFGASGGTHGRRPGASARRGTPIARSPRSDGAPPPRAAPAAAARGRRARAALARPRPRRPHGGFAKDSDGDACRRPRVHSSPTRKAMRMAAEPDAFLPLTRPSADGVDLRALPSSSVVEIASGERWPLASDRVAFVLAGAVLSTVRYR